MARGSAPVAEGELSGRGRAEALLYGLTLVLSFSLPFEPIRPWLALGWIDINHLKLLLLASLVVWASAGPRSWTELLPGMWPALLFLAVAGVSAVTAPTDRGDAVKFVGRLASGLYGLALVQHLAIKRPRLIGLVWAIVLGAGVSALLGLGEVAGLQPLQPLLALFKLAPTRVGGDLRVSASFQYATIASMFFELATPLALVLAATATTRWARGLATLIAATCSAVVVLTITRAGVIALAAGLAGMLALALAKPRWRKLALPTALAGLSMGIVILGLAVRVAALNTRFATENDWSWYGATYTVPDSLTLTPDAPTDATVVARNTGDAVWTNAGEHPFALAYRWLSADDTAQLRLPATMFDLPHDVSPGESIELTIPVTAHLPSGGYRIAWGMLQQNVLWFHDRGYPDAETVIRIVAGSSPVTIAPVAQMPRSDASMAAPPVPRSTLWSAALQMIAQHPLLGVGPDNFRHTYGSYVGLSSWDERVHANNLYLELLADVGVVGAAAFALVVGSAVSGLIHALRSPLSPVQAVWIAGAGASLATFFLHGTLDYFLDFTPVYLLFWLVVGLSSRVTRLEAC
jgi:O-antigen ligase/polysaccharide polymerase Wzy-like membrane protein